VAVAGDRAQRVLGHRPGLDHEPPASAVRFADGFDPQWRELALRAYAAGTAMMIGPGTGVLTALVAVVANLWRSRRSPATTD
jgi:hypothetical protein